MASAVPACSAYSLTGVCAFTLLDCKCGRPGVGTGSCVYFNASEDPVINKLLEERKDKWKNVMRFQQQPPRGL